MDAQTRRILRQHILVDQLFEVDVVPLAVKTPSIADWPETGAKAATNIVDDSHRLQVLADLDRDQVCTCTRCDLCTGRRQTVFGEGAPMAPVMFIGEGPGQREDEQGRPFVGPAGAMLDKWISAMGFDRPQVYIANVVKCRPPNNRAPEPGEVQACSPYLLRQIEIIRPRAIVALGGPATKFLLQTSEGITRLRGHWASCTLTNPTIDVMPTFHPAYLLRSYTTDNRAKVWSDLQKVVERIG